MKGKEGTIISIAGPVVKATGMADARIHDVVQVGKDALLGEIIEMRGDVVTAQVYEETDGLIPGEPISTTGSPLSVTLGPGLMSTIFDGVQRPLNSLKDETGSFIGRGISVNPLDEAHRWTFTPRVSKGDEVTEGDVLGDVQETSAIVHRVLVPPGVSGKITSISKGKKRITDEVAKVGKTSVTMVQRWPVKRPRPYTQKEPFSIPLITGQRVYDLFFPTVKGGQASIPGPFGAGKTMTQQAIAKWCDADIIVYIGCGERGNEMTDVLTEFPQLTDPRTGKPMMDRTVLIANTSNMPVAAREASIYTGITIAEYYRDQGYDVAILADSTSRWAEAMREISSRLEEMPGEEGYPAYLASRLAKFYERAGRVTTLGDDTGSVSVIGAVSPQGGDFSEPVTQSTLKIVKVFWALDAKLAAKRHFWAINWLDSYSLYTDTTDTWFDENVDEQWSRYRKKAIHILKEETRLLEIAQLVGKDSLQADEQFLLLCGRLLREDILQQNALDETDTYCPIEKQFIMLKNVIDLYEHVSPTAEKVRSLEEDPLIARIGRMKYEKDTKKLTKLNTEIRKRFAQ